MKKIIFLLLIVPVLSFSQTEAEEKEEEVKKEKIPVYGVFNSLKVINFESTKLAYKGDLYMIISHRFGSVQNGIDDFFGLDNSVTQFKFIYGFYDWLNVGISRTSNQKKYGLQVKYRLKQQEKDGFPVTIVGYHFISANTSLDDDIYPNLDFQDRLTYTSQVIFSRKINKSLSLLVSPTYIHENLATRSFVEQSDGTTLTYDEENDQFAVGLGGRYKISDVVSITMDYGIHMNRNSNSVYRNPLSIGTDLELGDHVFQLHFSNSQAMVEEGFITQAQGDWGDGDFFFGFNLIRIF
ncbi:MAG: DUF5777 family beta-barrel protein [Flavobacteriaceae bacterium]|nr:DUF5777 family beta-barrel protein [Flavobacteriaceae bacterium]